MTNNSGTLYAGVTNDIGRRVIEYREGVAQGFTSKYKVNRLLYCETFNDVSEAIEREKQIKAWRRNKKLELIRSANPKWEDLLPEQEFAASLSADQIPRFARNDIADA